MEITVTLWTYPKVILIVALCLLALGRCIDADNHQSADVMAKNGVHLNSQRKRAADKVPCQPMPRAVLQKIMGAAYNPRYMSIDRPEPEDAGKDVLPSVKSGQKDQAYERKRPPAEAFHVHAGFVRILHEEPVMDNNLVDVSSGAIGQAGDYEHQGPGSENQREFSVTMEPPRLSPTTVGHHSRRHHHRPPEGAKKAKKRDPLEKFKMDDFEQGEPPAESHVEPTAAGNGARLKPAADKFVQSVVRTKRTIKSGFPWSCESRIEWIDLGANHFPRFLRSVVCTTDKCWFGHFQCRPKAFTVKVLRRRKDSCSPEKDQGAEGLVAEESIRDENSYVPPEFREHWVFEERAVTFCCECAS